MPPAGEGCTGHPEGAHVRSVFPTGVGCLLCPAWWPRHDVTEYVEQDPARPIPIQLRRTPKDET